MQPALKREPSKKGMSLRWDEENLAVNEKIKEELNPIKITEPKTPYRGPLDPESDDDMPPLNLDEAEEAMANTQPGESSTSSGTTTPATHCSGDLDGIQQKRVVSTDSESHAELHEGAGVPAGEQQGKRRKFEESRKEHYNMKQMLLKARELLENEDDDGDQNIEDAA